MAKKYRVMPGTGPVSLRQSPDPASPKYEEWFTWNDGDTFSPPLHLKTISGLTLAQCVAAGHLEVVDGG